nr:M60 family metallopeptidase [uncultured Bacteroides sp.]
MKNNQIPVKKSFSLLLCTLLLCFSALTGCSDDNEDPGRTGWVRVLPLEVEFSAMGGEQNITLLLTEDIKPADLECAVAANGEDWCSVELEDEVLKVKADPTYYEFPRTTIVTVSCGDLRRDIPVSQAASSGSDDIKIAVASAKATTEETETEDRGIVHSYDGDYESYFNSKFGAFSDWPFIIDYTFKSASKLDYIVYYPRTDNGTRYGAFNEFKVYVATADAPDAWKKVAECARGDKNYNATNIKLEESVENVQKVRFEISSAHNNRISCAEMEFFQTSANKFDYTTIFTDETCSELKEGITEKDIRKMPGEIYKKLATALLNGTYDGKFRVAEYRPYQNPSIMEAVNKTSQYGLRDNPTGIYVNEGEELTVLVGNTHGQNISMVVQDLNLGYNASKTYALMEGENNIRVTNGGLIYIQNMTDEDIPLSPATEEQKAAVAAKTVKVHFPFGKVNGYFDTQSGATQADWEEMLRNAKYKDIDVAGKYVMVTWTVDAYKEYSTPILEVMSLIDDVVRLEWDFMGLFKYHKEFANRMYLHIEYNSKNPYSSANHTAYLTSYNNVFCSVDGVKGRVWVLGHEIGHSNQTRPGLKWTGTTEVTNNILANYVRSSFGKGSRLMDEDHPGETVYQEAIRRIKDAGKPHCLDNASDEYYVKLVPFWQLKLYIMDVCGDEDFYRDLFEHYRVTPDLNTTADTQGILQLDFVRQVCNLSQVDFTGFFEDWGFLTPVDKTFNDYGTKKFTITAKQISDLKKEIAAKNYPKAPDNLFEITDENYGSFGKPVDYVKPSRK